MTLRRTVLVIDPDQESVTVAGLLARVAVLGVPFDSLLVDYHGCGTHEIAVHGDAAALEEAGVAGIGNDWEGGPR